MRPKYVIIIDTGHLAGWEPADRVRLEKWLRTVGRRFSRNIYTIGCSTPTATLRAVSKLTGHGAPHGSFLVRGGTA